MLILFALACIVRSRDDVRWLAGAGALLALAHMVRVNGLVMLGMLVAFALTHARAAGRRMRWRHVLVPLAAFAIVAAPYLAWRAAHLPGAFDYGTNQRFWTDDPWNMTDAYWSQYSIAEGGPRETMSDHFGSHSAAEAWRRAYDSVAWQAQDLLVGATERAVLSIPLAALALAGIFLAPRGAASRAFLLSLAFTALTFVWIYPVVRSPRYFMPLVPLAAILAAGAVSRLSSRARVPALVIAPVAAYLAIRALVCIQGAREGVDVVREFGSVQAMVFVVTVAYLAAAAWPLVAQESAASYGATPGFSSTSR